MIREQGDKEKMKKEYWRNSWGAWEKARANGFWEVNWWRPFQETEMLCAKCISEVKAEQTHIQPLALAHWKPFNSDLQELTLDKSGEWGPHWNSFKKEEQRNWSLEVWKSSQGVFL